MKITEPPNRTNDAIREKLAARVDALDWSTRVRHGFMNANIITIAELVACDANVILELPSIGQTSLDEIVRELSKIGLSLTATSQEQAKAAKAAETAIRARAILGDYRSDRISIDDALTALGHCEWPERR